MASRHALPSDFDLEPSSRASRSSWTPAGPSRQLRALARTVKPVRQDRRNAPPRAPRQPALVRIRAAVVPTARSAALLRPGARRACSARRRSSSLTRLERSSIPPQPRSRRDRPPGIRRHDHRGAARVAPPDRGAGPRPPLSSARRTPPRPRSCRGEVGHRHPPQSAAELLAATAQARPLRVRRPAALPRSLRRRARPAKTANQVDDRRLRPRASRPRHRPRRERHRRRRRPLSRDATSPAARRRHRTTFSQAADGSLDH